MICKIYLISKFQGKESFIGGQPNSSWIGCIHATVAELRNYAKPQVLTTWPFQRKFANFYFESFPLNCSGSQASSCCDPLI